MNFVWDVPRGRVARPRHRRAAQRLAGCRASSRMRSGSPLTPMLQTNRSRSLWSPSLGPGTGRIGRATRPAAGPDDAVHGRSGAVVRSRRRSCCSRPGTFGNVGRNELIGPGPADGGSGVQPAVRGATARRAAAAIELRLEVFNLFNRANFGPPSLVAFSGTADGEAPLASFGQIRTTVTSARQVQVGCAYGFDRGSRSSRAMKARCTWTLAFVVALIPALASAQAIRGTIQGRVTDPSGQVVAGAEVVLVAERTGATRTTRTDARGWFLLTPVDSGAYEVRVSREGFRRHAQPVSMLVNQALRLDVVLQIGSISEVVTVTAPASTLDRAAGSLRFRIGADQVANLPLDGRNFLELALLAPGAAPARRRDRPARCAATSRSTSTAAREDANGFLLDGVLQRRSEAEHRRRCGRRSTPSASSRSLTSTPDASFGRNGRRPGQRRHAKSGTNRRERHGVRVLPHRRAQRAQLLRAEERAGARLRAQPVRRLVRRPDRARPHCSSSPTTRARACAKA